jgi:hypothetical protein
MTFYRLSLLLLIGAAVAAAQETRGDISGTVTDPQGGVIPGVTVTVTNLDTNIKTAVTTNSAGYYLAPLLITGNYSVVAEATGFMKLERTGLVLGLDQHMTINLTIEVGAVNESVQVSAQASLIDISSTRAGLLVPRQDVESLPVFADMTILLTRFVAGVNASQIVQYVNQGYASRTSVDYSGLGSIGGSEWTLDGLTNNGYNRQLATSPLGEIVQEFKVETSVFDASFGHSTGLSINQMTRSGVNDPHGSANWIYWNNRWNAANMFQRQNYYRAIDAANAAGNTSLANQLASTPIQAAGYSKSANFTLGGPVYIPKVINGRNKLFFFFAYGWNNELRIGPNGSGITTVPTPADLAGNFAPLLQAGSQYTVCDPLTVQPDPARAGHYFRTPFPNNQVPLSRIINPMYNFYVKLLPTENFPTSPGTGLNLRTQGDPDPITNSIWFNRYDYNLNDKHRFFLRWSYSHFTERLGNWTPQTVPFLETNDTVRHPLAATLNWTFAPSSHAVISAQFGTNEYYQGSQEIVSSRYKPTDTGLPSYMDQQCTLSGGCVLPLVSWAGYAAGVANGTSGLGLQAPSRLRSRNYQGTTNVTVTWGAHTFRFGTDVRQQAYTSSGGGYSSGNFVFDNTYTRRNDDTSVAPAGNLGLSWAAFMLGIPTTMSQDNLANYATSNPYYSGYVQDAWRITPKLTLNFGLRFEYERGMTERYDRMLVGWNPTAQLPITQAAQAAYAAAPLNQLPANSFSVVGGSLYANTPGQGVGRQAWPDQAMLLPRLAVAYEINHKTVLRAGYGIYYDTLNASNIFPNQLGFSSTTTTVASNNFGVAWNTGNPGAGVSLLADPFPTRANGTRFDAPYGNSLGLMMTAGTSYSYGNLNYKHPRLQRWSVGIQRELSSNTAFQAVYNGQYTGNVGLNIKRDPLGEQYWNQTMQRNTALDSALSANVTNPFYINNFTYLQGTSPALFARLQSLPFFTSPTTTVQQLLRPFPEMTSLTATNVNARKFRDHSLDMTMQRRFAGGLSANAAVSLNHAQDWSTVLNEYDGGPTQWLPTNNARPWRITGSALYYLPFGPRRHFLQKGILGTIIGGWQIGSTYELQPGPLITWPNVFFYGNISNIKLSKPIPSEWFNINAGFQRNAAQAPGTYQARVFPVYIDGLRQDWTNLANAALQRTFAFKERYKIVVRADAQNLFNRSQLAAPDVNPVNTTFGQSTSTSGQISRWYTFIGRVEF